MPHYTNHFYETLPGGWVLCTLCPHDCHIQDGVRDAAGNAMSSIRA